MKTTVFVVGAAFALTLILTSAIPVASGVASAADGKEIFLAQKCNMCHDVSSAQITATTKSEKMKGPNLTGIGKDAAWITQYIKKEVDLNGKKHMKGFTGPDGDLSTLATWIAGQK